MEQYNFLVRVNCYTYNQVQFIEDTLNGFCMQNTTFPYICCVLDDASTDGEQVTIRKYLQEHFDIEDKSVVRNEETDDYVLTFARHKTNINCFFAVYYLKYNHFSIKKSKIPYVEEWRKSTKYVAPCEGDDYWTDEMKLQKQVNFMKEHPECSLCFHRARIIKLENVKCFLKCDDIENREYDPNELVENWKVPAASIMFSEDVLKVKNIGRERVLDNDIILILNSALIGKIYGLSDVMSAYRVSRGGLVLNNDIKRNRLFRYPNHYRFIKDNYPFINKGLINRKILRAYLLKSIVFLPLPYKWLYRLTGR